MDIKVEEWHSNLIESISDKKKQRLEITKLFVILKINVSYFCFNII